MKNTINSTLIIALFVVSFNSAQEQKSKRADKDFKEYAYIRAIDSYEQLIANGYSVPETFIKLGDANYFNARYGAASLWYGKLFELETDTLADGHKYRYAHALRSVGDYEASDRQLLALAQTAPNDNRVALFLKHQEYLKEIRDNSGRYDIESLSINSKSSDFSTALYGNQLIFATSRDTGTIKQVKNGWNEDYFSDLYKANLSEDGSLNGVTAFSKKLNTKAHESSAVCTKDGKTLYFTRNNIVKNTFKRDDEGVSRLKILKAVHNGKSWTNVQELPFNSDGYSVAHPALSEDERTLYFSSNMDGTLGNSDIFKVAINDDGTYGIPEPLGPAINTESRETFPFVKDDMLYFASDGHPGLGGLDVFAVKLDDPNGRVVNLGEPINGKQDDFAYIINEEKKGFFSSNRESGQGSDDIYSFIENRPLNFNYTIVATLKFVSVETKQGIDNATITVSKEGGEEVGKYTTDENGFLTVTLDGNEKEYLFAVSKEGFDPKEMRLSVANLNDGPIVIELEQTYRTPIAIGENLMHYLGLQPILFDLNTFAIREDARPILGKVAEYLMENDELVVEIRSHTDAKASRAYNNSLSEKRAKATYAYLLTLGVSPNTLKYKGFGENQLLNDCSRWERCSAEENERNRRSELIVVEQ